MSSKMHVSYQPRWVQLLSEDINGKFMIRIISPSPFQFQMTSHDGDEHIYINMSKEELTILRDEITKLLCS